MHVDVVSRPALTIAAIRHVGPYDQVPPTFQRLMMWVVQNGLKGPSTEIVGLYYDDPTAIAATDLRFDAGIILTRDVPLADGMHLTHLPPVDWAVSRHVGPYTGIWPIYGRLIGEWLPESGRGAADLPWMEILRNSPREVPPDQLVTDICVALSLAAVT